MRIVEKIKRDNKKFIKKNIKIYKNEQKSKKSEIYITMIKFQTVKILVNKYS